jgi:hypothetical protein
MNFFGNKFKTTLLFIFFFELLSLLGHFVPIVNTIGLFVAVIFLIALSIKDSFLGLCFLFAELFIGSFGRLFSMDVSGFSVSVRMSLWLSVMLIWLIQLLVLRVRTGTCANKAVLKSREFKIFIPLFIFIVWGLVNALLNHTSLSYIINDANAWLYFSIIFPVFYAFKNSTASLSRLNLILQVFTASVIWISLKTFFILFIFSHKMIFSMSELYIWVRDTRIGEITSMENGFVRIFFQSHIFVLIATFIFFLIVVNLVIKNKDIFSNAQKRQKFIIFFSSLTLFFAVDLLNQSRSNWVGLFIGLVLCVLLVVYKYGWKKIIFPIAILFSTFIVSLALIVLVVKFPYPAPSDDFNTVSMLTDRGGKIKNEAGVSSRFALLPKLWGEIKTAPILGKGFGATVTYKSSDPRVLENNTEGIYTTFAFEWGWLDVWLKLGLIGVLSYLFLLFYIIFWSIKNLKKLNIIQLAFVVGLASISAVSFFSPYMNHPLGIAYLILSVIVIRVKIV